MMGIFGKPHTTISLDYIKPFLERNLRYAHEVDALHEMNFRDERVNTGL